MILISQCGIHKSTSSPYPNQSLLCEVNTPLYLFCPCVLLWHLPNRTLPLAVRECLLKAHSPHSRVSPPRPRTGPGCHVGPVVQGSHEKCDLERPGHNTGTSACCYLLGNTRAVQFWHAMSSFQCRGQESLPCVLAVPRHPPGLHHDFTARPSAPCSYSGILPQLDIS